jgi:hypothetical protein
MPIVCDTDNQYEYVLHSDRAKPKEEQPVFYFRYLSCREWREAIRLHDKYRACEVLDEEIELALQLIGTGLIGWKNIKDKKGIAVPYAIENVLDIVSILEKAELIQAVLNQSIDNEDKKKLEPQSPYNLELSVPGAPAPVNVVIDQQQ